VEKKLKQLKAYARSKGSSREAAEDFSQHCYLLFKTGKRDIRTNHAYLYIDWFRQQTHCGKKLIDENPTSTEMVPLIKLPKEMTERERIAIVLYCSWGFTMQEIAHCFGVSAVEISRLIHRVSLSGLR
jgi:DNA-directed RNA polymerase specialized sigma24 family protein